MQGLGFKVAASGTLIEARRTDENASYMDGKQLPP
jgi:hypothetical protein